MSENRKINLPYFDPRTLAGQPAKRNQYTAKIRKQQMNINSSVVKGPNGKFHINGPMGNTSNLNIGYENKNGNYVNAWNNSNGFTKRINDPNNLGRLSPTPVLRLPPRMLLSTHSANGNGSPHTAHGKRGRNNTPKGMMRRQMTSHNLNNSSPPTKKRSRQARKTRGKRN